MTQPLPGDHLTDPDCRYICDVRGCTKTYLHTGDLVRHKKSHGSQKAHYCPALHCDRVEKRGFARQDKLNDHMLAGHDEDTLFSCSHCQDHFTRDVFLIHSRRNRPVYFRTCPLPKCSFKAHTGYDFQYLDILRNHLLEKHDLRHRLGFVDLLKQRGYDARTGDFICPVCPANLRFHSHEEFLDHSMQTHFHGPDCGRHADGSCETKCWGRSLINRLSACDFVPIEVHRHRRTFLRIFPDFNHYPVWGDIERCSPVGS
jgi:hypothetical protein